MGSSLIITECLIILAFSLFPMGVLSLIIFLFLCSKVLCGKVEDTNTLTSMKDYESGINGQDVESTIELRTMGSPEIVVCMRDYNENISFL